MTFEEVARFHGHECPGLAIGYRMAHAAMEALAFARSEDEEVVAIVENDACGVDALQCIAGCTFGKGNLIFRDYGKQVYTVFSRTRGKAVRVYFHGTRITDEMRQDRTALMAWILSAPAEDILSVSPAPIPEPEPAKIRKSVLCERCGEAVMETRIRVENGNTLCIPCSVHE
jgi:formylmethanofuran dehydrogenase subunit E